MKQRGFSRKLIECLYSQGVRSFVLCAGGRNSPLVMELAHFSSHFLSKKEDSIAIYHFFNENSAAFFALGQIKKEGKPVAVVITSGTAVAETLPAVVEAHYTNLPLVIVSADRPVSYRGSGAPQSIEQVGLFSDYVQNCFELEGYLQDEQLKEQLKKLQEIHIGDRPIHINVGFDEPLNETSDEQLGSEEVNENVETVSLELLAKKELEDITSLKAEKNREILTTFLKENLKPIVIVGELNSQERQWVMLFLKNLRAPIFAESLSGIDIQKGKGGVEKFFLHSGDAFVQEKLFQGEFDSVLRIGGVPLLRAWRDLEKKLKNVPVLSISSRPFSGLSEKRNLLKLGKWMSSLFKEGKDNIFKSEWREGDLVEIFRSDLVRAEEIEKLLKELPESEMGLLYGISQKMSNGGRAYVGNSMAIRQWDILHRFKKKNYLSAVAANRGANGIDGQVSTFLGWAQSGCENWAFLGDLTSLYDQSGLWAARYSDGDLRLVVINNSGGRIFSRIFSNPAFLNEHEIEFSGWAKMWGFDYRCWEKIPGDISELPSRVIIELRPNLEETEKFWQSYKRVFKN